VDGGPRTQGSRTAETLSTPAGAWVGGPGPSPARHRGLGGADRSVAVGSGARIGRAAGAGAVGGLLVESAGQDEPLAGVDEVDVS
jgi:hypothetical protein